MNEHKYFLRNVVGKYMEILGGKNRKVVVVNADLAGTCRNTSFTEKYPNRSFNVGIAEQNLVSFSAGLSYEGFIPYVFSMAPFLSMRACEQIRTDVAYGQRNVRLIGVYAGVSGGISGATHWAIEDCGIMTSIPNIAVFEVSDPNQAIKLLDFSLEYSGPMYIRITIEPVQALYSEGTKIKLGGSNTVLEGDDGAFLCSGVTVQYAMEAAKRIREKTGKIIRVVDFYSLKPIDEDAIISAAKTGRIITVQDHNVFGGLGSLVSMVLAVNRLSPVFRNVGVPDVFVPMAHASYLYHKFGIDADGLESLMMKVLNIPKL